MALADESDIPDFRYWIAFETAGIWVDERSFLERIADLVARLLTANGYSVVMAERFGVVGGRWISYSLVDASKPFAKGAINVGRPNPVQ